MSQRNESTGTLKVNGGTLSSISRNPTPVPLIPSPEIPVWPLNLHPIVQVENIVGPLSVRNGLVQTVEIRLAITGRAGIDE